MTAHIPLVDLSIQFDAIWSKVSADIEKISSTGSFIGGPHVSQFEDDYAAFNNARHCVGVANGGDALELLLRAVGVKPGMNVIVPANSFVATASAVERIGAIPKFVDVRKDDHLIDADGIKRVADRKTKAIIPVHLFGQLANLKLIHEISTELGISVIEDGAQSHGATQTSQLFGSSSLGVATSFYPGKNLGAFGDAGAVLTDSDEIADQIRQLRNYGGIKKFEHFVPGYNSRLDAIQAIVLREKLLHLPKWNIERERAADTYIKLLGEYPQIELPKVAHGNTHVWHLFVIRIDNRDRIYEKMNAAGIGVGIHYPTPIHLLPAFKFLGHNVGSFPIAEAMSRRILSLPIFPGISETQISRVCDTLVKSVSSEN